MKQTEKPKEWRKLHPERKKSQIYICPHCQETCYCHSGGCNYRFCPHCGRRVSLERRD